MTKVYPKRVRLYSQKSEYQEVRPCAYCGKPIRLWDHAPGTHATLKYCSSACGAAARKPPITPQAPQVQLSSGTAGTVGELFVTVDLLKRGYHVFRAVSPSCPCDLIALRDGIT